MPAWLPWRPCSGSGRQRDRMNGELVQLVALVAHGNAVLAGDEFDAARVELEFVRSTGFEVSPGAVVSIAEWLGRSGALAPWLALDPWRLVAGASTWRADWEFDDRQWTVVYREAGAAPEMPTPDVSARDRELRAAIVKARDFAVRAGNLDNWVGIFDDALAADGSGSDLLLPPVGYPPDARLLLAMASTAWVFGGMGSWNDLGFADEETNAAYERVTRRLYRAVLTAIAAAVNSFEAG